MRAYAAGFYTASGAKTEFGIVSRTANPDWILESFHYIGTERQMQDIRDSGRTVFLDSGAFSAFTKGVTIDIDEYIAFTQRHGDCIHLVAALDVIGDPEASWRNFEYMRSQGVECVPCFHYGEPFEFLDEMVRQAPYIAIGGVAQLGTGPALTRFLDEVWAEHLVDDTGTPTVKVHGFAVTALGPILRYPWHSVDSTSWVLAARFGTIYLDLPRHDGGWKDMKVAFSELSPTVRDYDRHFDTCDPHTQRVIRERVEGLGYDLELLKTHYGWRDHFNIGYFRRIQSRGVERFTGIVQPTLF